MLNIQKIAQIFAIQMEGSNHKSQENPFATLENMTSKELYKIKNDLEKDIRAFPFARDLYLDRWKLVNDEIERRTG